MKRKIKRQRQKIFENIYKQTMLYVGQVKRYVLKGRQKSVPTLEEFWNSGSNNKELEISLLREEHMCNYINKDCDKLIEATDNANIENIQNTKLSIDCLLFELWKLRNNLHDICQQQ